VSNPMGAVMIPGPGRDTDGAADASVKEPLRRVLTWWLASRVLVLGLVVAFAAAARMPLGTHALRDGSWLLNRFAFWDSYHLGRIAEHGYFDGGRTCCEQAFLPGYPFLVRAVSPLVLGHTIVAGVLVSVLASTVAAWALWGIVLDAAGRTPVGLARARRAVLLLAVAPFGVFLVSFFSESLWLAGALVAWWAGSQRRWWVAGLGAAVACATRINGVFLVLALVVMYAVQLRADRRLRPRVDVLAFGVPTAVLAAYVTYLHAQTGSWTAYRDAQVTGWGRGFSWPWQSIPHQWDFIWAAPTSWLSVSRGIDLAVVLGGLVLTCAVLWMRRWAEAAYLVLSVGVILTSPTFGSSGRYALTWFPAYLVLAEVWERPRWRWLPRLAVAVALPLGAVVLLFFATRHWVA